MQGCSPNEASAATYRNQAQTYLTGRRPGVKFYFPLYPTEQDKSPLNMFHPSRSYHVPHPSNSIYELIDRTMDRQQCANSRPICALMSSVVAEAVRKRQREKFGGATRISFTANFKHISDDENTYIQQVNIYILSFSVGARL